MTHRSSSDRGEPTHDGGRLDRRGFLRSGAGVALSALGVAALGGSAAAHFPDGLEMDVRPGAKRVVLPPNGKGRVAVAVYAIDTFDPTEQPEDYRFGAPDVVSDGGGARPVQTKVRDVDGDGRDDLWLQFSLADAGFDGDETEARLEWRPQPGLAHGLSGTAAVEFGGGKGGK